MWFRSLTLLAAGVCSCTPAPYVPDAEGEQDGDCRDLTDNDGNGVDDCRDPGCYTSVDCRGDGDADTDTDTDTDADSDTDADPSDPVALTGFLSWHRSVGNGWEFPGYTEALHALALLPEATEWNYVDAALPSGVCTAVTVGTFMGLPLTDLAPQVLPVSAPASMTLDFETGTPWELDLDSSVWFGFGGTYPLDLDSNFVPRDTEFSISETIYGRAIAGSLGRTAADFSITAPRFDQPVPRTPVTVTWSGTGTDDVLVLAQVFDADGTVDGSMLCPTTASSITIDLADVGDVGNAEFVAIWVGRIRHNTANTTDDVVVRTNVDAVYWIRGGAYLAD